MRVRVAVEIAQSRASSQKLTSCNQRSRGINQWPRCAAPGAQSFRVFVYLFELLIIGSFLLILPWLDSMLKLLKPLGSISSEFRQDRWGALLQLLFRSLISLKHVNNI
jgi:hypothetical protein